MNIILYTYNTNGIYSGSKSYDSSGPVPPGLLVAPPKTEGTQVAMAVDGKWVLLDKFVVTPITTTELRVLAKVERAIIVASLTITTKSGRVYDADETSQNRMARAIVALKGANQNTTLWVLNDNTVVDTSVAELLEALELAGTAQSAIWVIPE
jgi:biopolymer transport protein ExbD